MAALRRIILRRRLRALRLNAGMSQADASEASGISDKSISHYETGRQLPNPATARGMAVAYGASLEAAKDIGRLAQRAGAPGWWEPSTFADKAGLSTLLDLDEIAERICQVQPDIIPGLLQTARYFRAVLAAFPDESDADAAVGLRLDRQRRIAEMPPELRPTLEFIVTEGAIRRAARIDPDIPSRLRTAAEANTVRVVPETAGAHAAMVGGFTIIRPRGSEVPPVVYTETASGSRYDEDADIVAVHQRVWDAVTAICVDIRETDYGR